MKTEDSYVKNILFKRLSFFSTDIQYLRFHRRTLYLKCCILFIFHKKFIIYKNKKYYLH